MQRGHIFEYTSNVISLLVMVHLIAHSVGSMQYILNDYVAGSMLGCESEHSEYISTPITTHKAQTSESGMSLGHHLFHKT